MRLSLWLAGITCVEPDNTFPWRGEEVRKSESTIHSTTMGQWDRMVAIWVCSHGWALHLCTVFRRGFPAIHKPQVHTYDTGNITQWGRPPSQWEKAKANIISSPWCLRSGESLIIFYPSRKRKLRPAPRDVVLISFTFSADVRTPYWRCQQKPPSAGRT